MAKTPIKTDYLYEHILAAIQRGEFTSRPFPSKRALAEETGMSMTTVHKAIDRCLEKNILISPKGSRKLKIHPSFSLGTPKKQIAAILPPLSPALAEWSKAIEETCSASPYNLTMVTYCHPDDPIIFKHLADSYDTIFFLPPRNPSSALSQQMKMSAERLVVFFYDYTKYGISSIFDPPKEFTSTILEYLYTQGCRTIDCVQAKPFPDHINSQVKIWKHFLEKRKCKGRLIAAPPDPNKSQSQQARISIHQHLASQTTLADALLCTTAFAAIGAVRGLADCGLRAGLDIKVAALSNNSLLQETTPSITCMKSMQKEQLILKALSSKRPLEIQFDHSELFIGESTEMGLHQRLATLLSHTTAAEFPERP